MNEENLFPEKQEHLLTDKKILDKLINKSELSREDRVIEIGAGTGLITKEIVKKAGGVLSFEIEKKFRDFLENIKSENLKIIYGNAINHSWKGYNKIVSNIPYSLSEQVITKAINENIELLVLVVGENFKEILEAKDSKIGIVTNLFFKVKIICTMDKSSFTPKPKTNSFIIKLEKKERLTKEEETLKNILFKEGKIKNAILYSLVKAGKTKRQSRDIINNLGIDNLVLEKPVASITGKFLMILRERIKKFV